MEAMRARPIPEKEGLGLDALRSAYRACAPREDGVDRITRTAKRLRNVPINFTSIYLVGGPEPVSHTEQLVG